MIKHVTDLPEKIIQPFIEYQTASDEASRHKALLGLGESLLIYLVGLFISQFLQQVKGKES